MTLPPFLARLLARVRWPVDVLVHIGKGVFGDGFTHAGNLAYLSLLTLFPFFIVVASVAGSLGRTDDGLRAVYAFLKTVPPDVATLLAKPIADVIGARGSGGLLTLGIIVTLWTVSGFVETIRDVIRRSYAADASLPVWKYRAGSVMLIVGAVFLMLLAFAFQVFITAIEAFVYRLVPIADDLVAVLGISRLAPAVVLFAALYGVFYILTPQRYRATRGCPIWPGALLTAAVWIGTTMLLPAMLALLGGYALTYGSLAGVIVALLFFYIVGLGLVIGARLNAALAMVPKVRLEKTPTATAG